MNIHWLQHVEFEGLGCIETWLNQNGHKVSCTRLWAGDPLPQGSKPLVGHASRIRERVCSCLNEENKLSGCRDSNEEREAPKVRGSDCKERRPCPTKISDMDGLIVMGGPMGIADDEQYPWLAAEKAFIKQMIDQNKPVLGICLGAQLIADVLGAKVGPVRRSLGEGGKNEHKEIGFYECRASVPLALNDRDGRSTFFPEQFVPFHWHGDTFGIPEGAVRLASSEATENQAFLYKTNVLALQFHLETTEESLLTLYENCSDEITDAPFIQSLEKMQENFPMLGKCNELMFALLKRLFL